MRTVTYEGRSVVFPDLPNHQSFLDALEDGEWRDQALQFIGDYVDERIRYIDIGAWIGVTPFWAAHRADKVIAVEPDPVCIGVIEEMNVLNERTVELIPKAVANDETISIVAVKGFGSSESSALAKGDVSVQSPGVRISDILNREQGGRFVIKIDVEGYEYMLRRQLMQIDSEVVKAVMIAVHPRFLLKSMSGNSLVNRAIVATRTIRLVFSMRGFRLVNQGAFWKVLFSLFFMKRPSFRDFVFVSTDFRA